MWLLAGAGFVSVVLAGCVNVPGMRNCVYVIIPYVITFGLGLSCVWAMFRLTGEREGKVKEYIYDAAVVKLPLRAAASAAFSALTFVLNIVFALTHGMGSPGTFFLFQGLLAVNSALSTILHGKIAKCRWDLPKV